METNQNVTKSQQYFEVKTSKLPKGRENVSHQVMINSNFAYDWLRRYHKFSEPCR